MVEKYTGEHYREEFLDNLNFKLNAHDLGTGHPQA
jgi:hypothetical protein